MVFGLYLRTDCVKRIHRTAWKKCVLGNSGTEGAVSAPLPLRFLKTCATAPMPPTSMKKPYTSGNAATPIKGLITKILLW
jgi:hypothetical protein